MAVKGRVGALNLEGPNGALIPASEKGAANGVATLDGSTKIPIGELPTGGANGLAQLDGNAKIPVSALPDSALVVKVVVADEAARLALTSTAVQPGDVVEQTSPNGDRYLLIDTDPSVAANWQEIAGAQTTIDGADIIDGTVTEAKLAPSAIAPRNQGETVKVIDSGFGAVSGISLTVAQQDTDWVTNTSVFPTGTYEHPSQGDVEIEFDLPGTPSGSVDVGFRARVIGPVTRSVSFFLGGATYDDGQFYQNFESSKTIQLTALFPDLPAGSYTVELRAKKWFGGTWNWNPASNHYIVARARRLGGTATVNAETNKSVQHTNIGNTSFNANTPSDGGAGPNGYDIIESGVTDGTFTVEGPGRVALDFWHDATAAGADFNVQYQLEIDGTVVDDNTAWISSLTSSTPKGFHARATFDVANAGQHTYRVTWRRQSGSSSEQANVSSNRTFRVSITSGAALSSQVEARGEGRNFQLAVTVNSGVPSTDGYFHMGALGKSVSLRELTLSTDDEVSAGNLIGRLRINGTDIYPVTIPTGSAKVVTDTGTNPVIPALSTVELQVEADGSYANSGAGAARVVLEPHFSVSTIINSVLEPPVIGPPIGTVLLHETFDSLGLPGWTLTNLTAGTVDPTVDNNGADGIIDQSSRPGWALLQPKVGAAESIIEKVITALPTDATLIFQFSFPIINDASFANEATRFEFAIDDEGSNSIRFLIYQTDLDNLRFGQFFDASDQGSYRLNSEQDTDIQVFSHAVIYKKGTSYEAWLLAKGVGLVKVATGSITQAITRVRVRTSQGDATITPTPVYGVGDIRILSGIVMP